ncbi:dethiobiotin synthase [Nitratifractor salsuginis DSM 16511]|uniref:ATP-dependent dethiobiotin synthetase BioD n=1 Tax=Nitratifractor salsuginis (strain DSM 16511 / JCM 12458 / E9I37-1) TaxID=749222 RepID=E6WZH5_NITSE|nr:dethiobiotin synthase [Nitratifractor salsuginis DSM 16511]
MPRIFITATGTGVGKTYASCRIIEALGARGIRVGACKPVETGVTSVPADAAALLQCVQRFNPAFAPLSPEDLCAYTFPLPAAPFCADTERIISLETLFEKIRHLESLCDLLVIEGAGGLMVPITRDYAMVDLARDLEAPVLLVSSSELGGINPTLLSLELLRNRRLPHDWCVNLYRDSDSFVSVTRPYYDAAHPGWWSLQEGLDRYLEKILDRIGKPDSGQIG